jgi:dynein heavy chain
VYIPCKPLACHHRASQVRESLIKKKEKLVALLKGLCARVPRKMMAGVVSKFGEIERVLRAKTNNLEDVDEQRK